MISDDLWNATLRLWEKVDDTQDLAWAPWVKVPMSLNFTMISLVGELIDRSFMFDRKIIPSNKTKAYQELVRLAGISPWSELFVVLPKEEGLTVSKNLSNDDLERIFLEKNKHIKIATVLKRTK
jgi:hypothetical protein